MYPVAIFAVAEREGFEPSVHLIAHLISSQGRYNHFDISPYFVFTIGRVKPMRPFTLKQYSTKRGR